MKSVQNQSELHKLGTPTQTQKKEKEKNLRKSFNVKSSLTNKFQITKRLCLNNR